MDFAAYTISTILSFLIVSAISPRLVDYFNKKEKDMNEYSEQHMKVFCDKQMFRFFMLGSIIILAITLLFSLNHSISELLNVDYNSILILLLSCSVFDCVMVFLLATRIEYSDDVFIVTNGINIKKTYKYTDVAKISGKRNKIIRLYYKKIILFNAFYGLNGFIKTLKEKNNNI
ncbi:MAG TPA: hypothetical protein PLH02_03110 [Bacillota bacterium]|nr:hypothetical protein [Bacillota bacterium]HPJ85957.1 hypothetical protein [Bacillota bacterium]HPQ61851.1 hypothetical protein [Bacillota bacterium]